ncbi:MAG: sodium-dependent bicarbonate transport family permease [Alcanivoracaceae bacterium]|nr:sodium-dependent bicarbonate transport family permease [Alcanivoracaceae bacterium]
MPDILIAFFVLGLLAGMIRSDLALSGGAHDLIGIMLMMAIGLKGGMAMSGQLHPDMLVTVVTVLALGFTVPLICYAALRGVARIDGANSASLAAHYGSVSAGTFAIALAYAERHNLTLSPDTTLHLVLLEVPAIIVGVLLYKYQGGATGTTASVIREAVTGRGVVLMVGGLLLGLFYGEAGADKIVPLFIALFPGFLALFLLEAGISTAKYLRQWHPGYWRLVGFALLAPPVLALIGLSAALALDMPAGSAVVLATLLASASYIAAPAAVRHAMPQANVGMALFAALGVTFPFNVLIGIPLYNAAFQWLARL